MECLYREGDRYVKEAMTVGLLEDLKNQNIHNSTHPDQFREFLGTEAQEWWDKLYRFWDHGELLTDD